MNDIISNGHAGTPSRDLTAELAEVLETLRGCREFTRKTDALCAVPAEVVPSAEGAMLHAANRRFVRALDGVIEMLKLSEGEARREELPVAADLTRQLALDLAAPMVFAAHKDLKGQMERERTRN